MSWNNDTPDFGKVFEAWDQPSHTTSRGWTITPAVGTFGHGMNSHFTSRPDGQLDHYSVYDGYNKLEQTEF